MAVSWAGQRRPRSWAAVEDPSRLGEWTGFEVGRSTVRRNPRPSARTHAARDVPQAKSWGAERPVYGKIRYVSYQNTSRRFDGTRYIQWVETLTRGGEGK